MFWPVCFPAVLTAINHEFATWTTPQNLALLRSRRLPQPLHRWEPCPMFGIAVSRFPGFRACSFGIRKQCDRILHRRNSVYSCHRVRVFCTLHSLSRDDFVGPRPVYDPLRSSFTFPLFWLACWRFRLSISDLISRISAKICLFASISFFVVASAGSTSHELTFENRLSEDSLLCLSAWSDASSFTCLIRSSSVNVGELSICRKLAARTSSRRPVSNDLMKVLWIKDSS
jgi:hypothetical protein